MRLPCEVMFLSIMLTVKCIFAYYQIYFCLLSNVNMIAIKCNLTQVSDLELAIKFIA